ncbi:DUF4115 domain-containing protein [soil metagenome]
MTEDSYQDTLFEDPIGLRFRHAREKARWSIEAAAQQLKLPVAVLDAIEKEDWGRLGAPIFVRSYLGSYARLLGLPISIADEVVKGTQQPQLASVGNVPPRRRLDRRLGTLARLALTVAVIAAIAAGIWFLQGRLPGATQADAPGTLVASATPGPSVAATAPVEPATQPLSADSTITEPAPFNATAGACDAAIGPAASGAAAQAGEIQLRFRGDSWIEVLGADGVALERGLVGAGAERRYGPGRAIRVMIGDAAAVDAFSGNSPLDLSPYRTAKVARFTVSSDGSLHPVTSD